MSDEYAWCCKHNQKCKVPGADIVVAGTSCKDFSKASHLIAAKRVTSQETTSGGSAQQVRGLIAYIAKWSVQMLLFENADMLAESSDNAPSALDDIKDWLRKLGMMTLPILTDAQLFGLPTERRRFYLVALKAGG